MLENSHGHEVPAVTFKTRQNSEWVEVTSNELFDRKEVLVFALPGAFTLTAQGLDDEEIEFNQVVTYHSLTALSGVHNTTGLYR